MKSTELKLFALQGFPMVQANDDLPGQIAAALEDNKVELEDGDIVVVAQKVVSKAEDRFVDISTIEPTQVALDLACQCAKDPRLVEIILRESTEVVRCVPGVLIVRHKLGLVMANAGVDHSNVGETSDRVLLLPQNPDKSASRIMQYLQTRSEAGIAVLINDSFGRPFRMGTCGVCIGSAGIEPLDIRTGSTDLFGKELVNTEIAVADEIAAAASLLMGQVDEATPVVVLRGLSYRRGNGSSSQLIRAVDKDLFLARKVID